MANAILKQMLEQLHSLEPEELQQLNQAVQDYLVQQGEIAKQFSFHQALVSSGLVKQIKKPSYRQSKNQQLVQIDGEPISRTIIEERR